MISRRFPIRGHDVRHSKRLLQPYLAGQAGEPAWDAWRGDRAYSGNGGKCGPASRAFIPCQIGKAQRSRGQLPVHFLEGEGSHFLSIARDMDLHPASLLNHSDNGQAERNRAEASW